VYLLHGGECEVAGIQGGPGSATPLGMQSLSQLVLCRTVINWHKPSIYSSDDLHEVIGHKLARLYLLQVIGHKLARLHLLQVIGHKLARLYLLVNICGL